MTGRAGVAGVVGPAAQGRRTPPARTSAAPASGPRLPDVHNGRAGTDSCRSGPRQSHREARSAWTAAGGPDATSPASPASPAERWVTLPRPWAAGESVPGTAAARCGRDHGEVRRLEIPHEADHCGVEHIEAMIYRILIVEFHWDAMRDDNVRLTIVPPLGPPNACRDLVGMKLDSNPQILHAIMRDVPETPLDGFL